MRRYLVPLLLVSSLLVAIPASARSPSGVVRDFFTAVEQHDFAQARTFTRGAAAQLIGNILGDIDRQAADKHAEVEISVRSLQIVERPANGDGQIPIDVVYDVAVYGKKWMLRKMVRRISGTASFLIEGELPHIAAIVGNLAL